MEDEAQKMVALKKAYADIILNTAKEAAARIMVSERKALRFQQDLCATKDEALRMLVRLKQMIDSKTTEAEATSLSQQRRIEELEAQLQEAEDVITDLRAELKWTGDELEKAKKNQVQLLNGKIAREDSSVSKNSTFNPIIPTLSGLETVTASDMINVPMNQKVLDDECCKATKQSERLDNFYTQNSDFASIIMRTKEPELYRNGCTQRIRAFERNLPDGKLPPSSANSLVKDEFTIKATDREEVIQNLLSLRNNRVEMVKNVLEGEMKKPVKVRTSRRRKTRFGKAKTARGCKQSQLMKSCQPYPFLSHCKTKSVNVNDRSSEGVCAQSAARANIIEIAKTSDELEEKMQHKSNYHKDIVKIINKGKRKRKMKSGDDNDSSFTCSQGQLKRPCEPSSVLSRCRSFAYLVNGGVKSGEDLSNAVVNEAKLKPLPRLDPGVTLIESDRDPISGCTSVTMNVEAINKSGDVRNAADNDIALIDEPVVVKEESTAVENSGFPSSELNLEILNVSSVNSDLKDVIASEQSNESPSHVENSRLLKYTFQRKRKKEAVSNPDEIASPEKSSVEMVTVDKENNGTEPQKSRNESSRDSRRLAQVARQFSTIMINLSHAFSFFVFFFFLVILAAYIVIWKTLVVVNVLSEIQATITILRWFLRKFFSKNVCCRLHSIYMHAIYAVLSMKFPLPQNSSRICNQYHYSFISVFKISYGFGSGAAFNMCVCLLVSSSSFTPPLTFLRSSQLAPLKSGAHSDKPIRAMPSKNFSLSHTHTHIYKYI
ncbi:hypothetical protein FNV43_RR14414 [Rhamnella rubrinervis]|uniref:Uncharacterized protein n=1 Tax=Rhamnella rubrinervis TaxID=2594499 RepID=A0A8K0H2S7_9ROSA|nr:hypothetical protein FNV43_RR14414 [Rhamnella rubrinervis]